MFLVAFAVAGCGPSAEETAKRLQERARAAALDTKLDQAIARANSGFEKIVYPACPAVWAAKKATNCGRATYKIAMAECRHRTMQIARVSSGTPELLDEGAGDTWIRAAGGLPSVMTDDERLDLNDGGSGASMPEALAVILGDETRSIAAYGCDLTDYRLTGVHLENRRISVPKPDTWK